MIRQGSLTPATSQRPDRRGSRLADGGGLAAHMTGQAWTGLARTAQPLRPGLLAVVIPTMTAPPLERDPDCRRDLGRQPGSYDSDVTSSCFGREHDHAIIDRRIGRRAAGCRPRQRAGTPNLSDNVVGGLQPLRARSWIPMPLRAERPQALATGRNPRGALALWWGTPVTDGLRECGSRGRCPICHRAETDGDLEQLPPRLLRIGDLALHTRTVWRQDEVRRIAVGSRPGTSPDACRSAAGADTGRTPEQSAPLPRPDRPRPSGRSVRRTRLVRAHRPPRLY
jgi:hypothetical protein